MLGALLGLLRHVNPFGSAFIAVMLVSLIAPPRLIISTEPGDAGLVIFVELWVCRLITP